VALWIAVGSAAGLVLAASGRRFPLSLADQDILLAVPMEGRTLVRAQLLVGFAVAALVSVSAAAVLVAIVSRFIVWDTWSHFLAGLAAFLPVLMAAAALPWVGPAIDQAAGRWRQLVAGAVGVILLVAVLWFLWRSFTVGPGALVEAWRNPLVGPSVAMPAAAVAAIRLGSTATSLALASMLGLSAAALLGYVWTFPYEFHEPAVSPYFPTAGRGTERESPPHPRWFTRLGRALRVRYQPLGPASQAIFGLSYGNALGLAVPFSLALSLLLWTEVLVLRAPDVPPQFLAFRLNLVLAVLMPMAWILGAVVGLGAVIFLNTATLRTLPVSRSGLLASVLIPPVVLVGLGCLPALAFGVLLAWSNARMVAVVGVLTILASLSGLAGGGSLSFTLQGPPPTPGTTPELDFFKLMLALYVPMGWLSAALLDFSGVARPEFFLTPVLLVAYGALLCWLGWRALGNRPRRPQVTA
jgi:hypothetical protein